MSEQLKIEVVDYDNYKIAIKLQKEVFPKEDGTINILSSLDRELFMKTSGIFYPDDKVKYYLAYYQNEPVGITGLYSYVDDYPDDAWIAWYGVKKEFRNRGFGVQILNWTINKAKNDGYKTIRLYTDDEENKEAIQVYKKIGFVGEEYSAEKLYYNCYIYSKSLTDKPLELWNNKVLDLSYQSELDHFDNEKVSELLDKYDLIINNKNSDYRAK